ncbi:MAG: hypothetical protein J0I06_24990 [Planctomycetes bacterium]|nr:hypothetical protein [Planctomycetota bacterium]
MRLCLVVGVLMVGGMGLASRADEPKKADKAVSYKTDVAPLLKDACASCHSGAKKKARLDVTDYDSLMKFVKAGEPDKSKLHMSLLGKGAKQMPPKNPLAADQVAVIRAWIAGGAKKD